MRRPSMRLRAPLVHALAAALAAASLLLAALLPSALARQNAADDLVGVYSVTLAKPDLPPGLPGQAALLGTWTVTFNANGTYTLARQDVGVVTRGAYEVDGATLSVTEWDGLIGCGEGEPDEGDVRYAWRQAGDGVVMTAISDTCAERRILLQAHPLVGFEACAVMPEGVSAAATPDAPGATPVAMNRGVSAQEGLPEGEKVDDAIDTLLRQATGCWATGEPARFLALHGSDGLAEISSIAPLAEFARDLRLFMATPISFRRISDVTSVDPNHAWAYVEITLGGEPVPQRLDFVREDGVWLFDRFFLFSLDPTLTAGSGAAP